MFLNSLIHHRKLCPLAPAPIWNRAEALMTEAKPETEAEKETEHLG
ncbi:MAG: hypothetical protein LBF22_01160 [Deltaproteobacteria bacterium]|nr:hypothetical protein [Deltaproteobacteria bacterium]